MAVKSFLTQVPQFKEYSFLGDDAKYIIPSFTDLECLTYQLSEKIIADQNKFDLIVTLAKGGWAMTRSLVDFTQIDAIASIGVKFYIDIGKRLTEPRVYQDLPLSVSGKNVLIFDDVADSGGSLVFVKKLLEERDAQKVRTATLFYKPKSVIKPDYFAAQTAAWILFPFERVEMGQLLASKWQEQGIKPTEIKKRVDRLKLISTIKE